MFACVVNVIDDFIRAALDSDFVLARKRKDNIVAASLLCLDRVAVDADSVFVGVVGDKVVAVFLISY